MSGTTECVNQCEFNWPSVDGLMLYARSWMPECRPRAVINYIHGFKDHSNRFGPWAEKLTREGFGVLSIDLRGHGRSQGRRGFAGKYDLYLQDVQELFTRSREMYGDIPHILYGHSLGGNLVTNYLIRGNNLPLAAVITSPWFTLAVRPSLFALTGATLLRYLFPFVVVRSDLDPCGLSHDPVIADDYRKDPLVHNKILPRLFFEIEENGLKASRNIYKINIPLLVMHGSADTITSCRKTRSFVLNAGKLTTYKEWKEGFHELHNDFQSDEVFRFLVSWLNKQVSQISPMEKFRTVIEIPAMVDKITYHTPCMFIGSCFAGEIGEKMQNLKFPVLINPFGTLFNPASIGNNLKTLIAAKPYTLADLDFHNGMWFSFNHYTGFACRDKHECLDAINRSHDVAVAWLKQCTFLVVTFGTAWTYTHRSTGRIVANCHKLPAAEFSRALQEPGEIADSFGDMLLALRKMNPGIRVIITVSPVRHWKDGAMNNQLSKSVLLLSVHRLMRKHDNVRYFPAYEIFMDELRDYRFYAGDMLHPSEQGIDYVWERFCDTGLDDKSKKIMAGVAAILKAVSHRPRQTDSPDLVRFRENTLKQIDQLKAVYPFLDFSREIAFLGK